MQIRQVTKQNSEKTIISVLNIYSEPIENAQVLLIAKNNTYFDSQTDVRGCAVFSKIPTKTYSVFIAHSDYPAYVVDGYALTKNLKITLKKLGGFSSIIFPNSTGHIPELDGRLNPILDTLDRTYLYANNIAIEGGKNQPATFVIGKPVILEDKNGVLMAVTFIRIQGDSSLLQYKKMSVSDRDLVNNDSRETLSLITSTSESVESRVVDLDKSKNKIKPFGRIERITNNPTASIVIGGLLLSLILFLIYQFSGVDLKNPQPENISTVTQTSVSANNNKVTVTGGNYSEAGFNLSVPRGNISSCIWTWVAGTGNIPGSRTTDSTSAIANSHQFIAELFNGRDFKVGCTNDYGDYYEGQFSD